MAAMKTQGERDDHLLLYGTCPDMDCGKRLARALLDARLVACVNLLPGMVSLYLWQGAMEEGGEVAFIAKTTRACWPECADLFAKLHPYDEPALVALEMDEGLPGFLGWISGM